jgi:hypothetical protein
MKISSRFNLVDEDDENWEVIQKKFSELKDLNEIYVLLNIYFHKWQICSNLKCDAFVSLSQLEKRIDSLPFSNLKEAQQDILNDIDKKLFEKVFNKTLKQAKRILRELFAMKTTHDTQRAQAQVYHERNLEVINALINSNHPVPIEVAQGINTYLAYNSQMGETSSELKEYNEKLQREERRRKNKKSRSKNEDD